MARYKNNRPSINGQWLCTNLFDVIYIGMGDLVSLTTLSPALCSSFVENHVLCGILLWFYIRIVSYRMASHRIMLWMFCEWACMHTETHTHGPHIESLGWHSDNRTTSFRGGCAMRESVIDISINTVIFRLFHIKITIKFHYLLLLFLSLTHTHSPYLSPTLCIKIPNLK